MQEYKKDHNPGAKAVIRAGYSERSYGQVTVKGAKQAAARLLTNVDLKALIGNEETKISEAKR